MTTRNRLKKEAHDLAARIWEWDNKKSRNRMYQWLYQNRKHFDGNCHIRHMDVHHLRHLINMLGLEIHKKEAKKKPIPKKVRFLMPSGEIKTIRN